ncbi:MAG: 50S ribosomal protein L25/general stress protein Ctc [Bdellovibrionales bacterium]
MSDIITLTASSRESVGKGPARAVRCQQQVPAVVYGDKKPALAISIEEKELVRYVNKAGFFNHLFDIELDGKKHRVLPRDVQFHPVTDRPLHVDFLRVSKSMKVKVSVPIVYTEQNLSDGMKRGGALNVIYHEIEVLCAPDKIPERFEVSLKEYGLGAAISVTAIELPKDIELTAKETEFTVASITVPSAVRSKLIEEASAAGPAAAADSAKKAAPKAAPAKK